MDIFLFLCGLIAFVYFLMTWVLPKILSWIFAIKYQIKVTIGFIKIPYLTLKDINISRNGISVHIDEIRVTSSLFNSEVSKLFAFIARDVRLNKVILVTDKYKRKRQHTESLNISDIKLPTSFITFAQFTYIQLTNISAIWAGNTGWSIHTTATELKLEGNSSSKSHGLAVAIEMSQAKTRIQRRTESNHLNFAEICFAINANLVLFKLIPDKINIAIRHPSCIVNEDLFKYIEWSHEEEKEQTTHMQFLKLIPKNFMLEVDDTEISSTLGEGKDLNAKFQACRVNIRCNTDLEYSDRLFYLAFQMDGISVDSCTQKVFLMNTVSLDAKLQNKVANVYILLNTVTVILNPELWPCIELAKSESPRRRHEKNIFDDWSIQSCAEVWTASGTLSNKSFLLCGHMKLIMEYVTLQWRAELLLESLGWTLAGLNTIDRRSHTIGTPLFLAVALLKFSYTKRHATIDAMFDAIRMEWNSEVSDMLSARIKDKTDGDSVFKRIMPDTWALKLTLSNINLFFVLDNIANISLRFDSLAVEGSQKKISIRTTGLKILELDIDTKTYICVRSKDIMKSVGAVKSACFDVSRINQNTFEWTLMTSECFEFFWTYILHMKIISILRSFPKQKSPAEPQSKTVINWTFCFNRLNFNALLLNHELLFDGIQMYIKGPVVEIRADSLNLFVDKEHVIISDKLSLSQSDSNIELLRERDEAEGLESKHNNAWIFSLSMLEARFPYKHNFADAIQNELVSTIKWLKKVHNKKKVPFTLDSPLPRDLLIKIDECLFEMSDDPFEVKLRDNYELLEDEYKESLKRQQMLDAKIAELCKTHLLLPSGKVDELYASLSKKNAEIYVQRSKQINSSGPQRTRLLEWRLTELSIAALADLSVHGTERALNFLRSVDPVSPFPIEGLTCSTLWVRTIAVTMKHSTVSLRDFPQPFLEYKGFHMWGRLAGAEPVPPPRSIRVVEIDLSPLWDNDIIERGMTQLKFYYDINLEMEYYSYAFGPCWEPVIAQCNLSMENIFSPSRDPSPPLPFWDKMRLLLHGRLTMVVKHMTVLLHASLDPYNTTEEMELAWSDMALDWTNAKIVVKGDLDIYVRTASKYDDCRLLHLPNLKLTIKLNWVCLADPNDHHVVIPCAPDKLPEYSSNQEHDSYRAFRSQNIDTSISLETKGRAGDSPALLLYGSTLRWFESLQLILSGVTRPTRRGLVFGPLRARKKTLSRHYRKVRVLLSLQQFQNSYWMSCAMQRGFELLGSRVVCSSEHCLTLIPINDGLIRRPKAVWSIAYMNCELTNAEVWLKSSLQVEQDDEMLPPIEKFYCLSVEKVSYGRETPLVDSRDTPTHKLVVYDLKGAWTKSNRDVAFALFDAYVKTQQLRRNLSAEALRTENIQCEVEQARPDVESKSPPEDIGQRPSPASMLQKLIAEAEHKAVVFSDDQSPAGIRTQLQGLQACQLEDVLHKNWLIALVNSQVVLRGCETKGYVILSAAKAEILQRLHGPTPKTTWVGSLECLQYYATVGTADEDIMWLPVELIQERCGAGAGPAAVVGSGRAAGGVVSQVVGAAGRQLQRIVSRCRCEFFYVSFDSTDPSGPIFDAFTLMHHDLDVCTNSVQYAMLLDIVNSLLLYVEPTRKEAAARLARLRFQLQLRSDRSVRVPVQKLQTQVRVLLGTLRRLERDAHLAGATPAARRIHKQLSELKSELSSRTEELDMLLAIHRGSAPQTTVRSHEIYFKHAQWRLTDADGQLGIADLVLSNFLYTKNSKSDGSVEHLLELGYIHMTNLLPNQIYTEVLSPTEIQRDMPVDHKHVLRVFCRERPPVGGISVKEHFEINVLPITIGLTKKFYNTMLKFCFPERDDPDAMQSKVSKDTSFYVRIDQKDDVEKMKERAEKNKLFIYIKIPEVPVRVSYKGNKEKNIEDVRDFSLVIPTLEYHNVTWTWLDLLLAMKSDTRRVILSQAIKQKLQIHRGRGSAADQNTPQEADKARMLFGKLHPPK